MGRLSGRVAEGAVRRPVVWFGGVGVAGLVPFFLVFGPLPGFSGGVAGWLGALLAVQPVYPWIADRWGTPALRPPDAWRPAVFLARLLGSFQLTCVPLVFGALLIILDRAITVWGVLLLTPLVLLASCIGTYCLREQLLRGLPLKALPLLPACALLRIPPDPGGWSAAGEPWTAFVLWLLTDAAVLTALATAAARLCTGPRPAVPVGRPGNAGGAGNVAGVTAARPAP